MGAVLGRGRVRPGGDRSQSNEEAALGIELSRLFAQLGALLEPARASRDGTASACFRSPSAFVWWERTVSLCFADSSSGTA